MGIILFLAFLTTIIVLLFFISRGKRNDNILMKAPMAIQSYVDVHFPNNAIVRVVKDTNNDVFNYNILLVGNIELKFNTAQKISQIEASTELPTSVIPIAIMVYVQANYPNNRIVGWGVKNDKQHAELNNYINLIFGINGVFLYKDED